jgi:hypothetical protein
MTGEMTSRKIRIMLNGNTIKPWDPFARQEPATKELEPVTLHYDHDSVTGEILIQPFVLPHQEDFSSLQAHAEAAGPDRWNKQQGFYIYRANRMIQSGGWCNLRTLDEHLKLARVAVSFRPTLDEAFRINVAKMRVQLPQQLREQFEKAIGPVSKIAQTAYRRAERSGPKSGPGARLHSPASGAGTATPAAARIAPVAPPSRNEPAPRLWSLEQLRTEAVRISKARERPVVTAVFERLSRKLNGG